MVRELYRKDWRMRTIVPTRSARSQPESSAVQQGRHRLRDARGVIRPSRQAGHYLESDLSRPQLMVAVRVGPDS
jgi:hypothetical protein